MIIVNVDHWIVVIQYILIYPFSADHCITSLIILKIQQLRGKRWEKLKIKRSGKVPLLQLPYSVEVWDYTTMGKTLPVIVWSVHFDLGVRIQILGKIDCSNNVAYYCGPWSQLSATIVHLVPAYWELFSFVCWVQSKHTAECKLSSAQTIQAVHYKSAIASWSLGDPKWWLCGTTQTPVRVVYLFSVCDQD